LEKETCTSNEIFDIPLTLNRSISSTTIGIFDNQILVDCTHDEELVVSSLITVLVDDKGNLCGIYKHGKVAIPPSLLNKIIETATNRPLVVAQ
jgi:exosome complex RNA-binding protein Rrp42 (RNase PH superfamily)